ncbi:MAG: hypothetical protein II336_12145 [Loktanella sp.]|nr:hypothetical protein [Loktanella sp.]
MGVFHFQAIRSGAVFTPQLPATSNVFFVVIDGDIEAGRSAEKLAANMVGWSEPSSDGASTLALRAGQHGARLLLYAGKPQDMHVVAKGPFIAGS